MNPIYNAAIRLYGAAVRAASARNVKASRMVAGHRQVWDRLAAAFTPADRPVWIHASSLGEFEQGRPLIEKLRREKPGVKILLTFFSPSGYEVRKDFPGVDCVTYLPFDTPSNARRFVAAVNPSVAIFVKYEFWGNYLSELRRRDVPTYLISAIFRPKQAFFRPWGGMFRSMLRCFTRIFVQDERSASLLASVGVDSVVAGDTRFDRVTDILRTAAPLPALEPFIEGATGPVMVAGSSWQPDEDVYLPWLNSRPDVRLIIAPHEFDEARLASIAGRVEGRCVRFSQLEADPEAGRGARCVIVDCFGKLASIYRYGDMAYVGGGFGTSIHNINEAAVYGIPVVFGPVHAKFKEATDLLECGGAFEVTDRQSCATVLSRLADDHPAREAAGRAAGDYIRRNLGATDRVYADVFR